MGNTSHHTPELPAYVAFARNWTSRSLIALFAIPAFAQEAKVESNVVQAPPPVPSVVPASAPEQSQPAAPTGKAPEEKKLEELLKLKFDRSPASILRIQDMLLRGEVAGNPVEQFRRNVVAGRWKEVGAFLKSLPEKDAIKAYEHLLKELDKAPTLGSGQPQQQNGPTPTPTLQVSEIADLIEIAPRQIYSEQNKLLAALLRRVLAANGYIEPLVERLEAGVAQMGDRYPIGRELIADLFFEVARASLALKFLPPLEPGQETKSFALLERHSKAALHMGRQENNPEALLRSWQLNQLLLASAHCTGELRDRAWRRYADIVRFLPSELTAQALKETFLRKADEGHTLLKQIGVQVSDDRLLRNTSQRRTNLQMQRHAADALLPVKEHRAQWQSALELFASNWVEEADYAKRLHVQPRNQPVQYDPYGNPIFYGNQQPAQPSNQNQLPAIPIAEVLPSAPSEEWIAALNPAVRTRVLTVVAELHLKLEEDAKALPYLEKLAVLQPKEARRLSNDLLRVWAATHDPQRNSNQRRPMYYGPVYQTPQGIPLTRALQQKNLEELSSLLRRLRALPIEPLDNGAIVNAFTTAHSQAEVFREESIELVFGKLEQIAPETLAELLQTMRRRLANQWRKPNVQQQAKTQRTDAQIDAEVLRGYELLAGLIQKGLEREADNWRLHLAQAATWFDWAEFQYGKKVDLEIYVEKRDRAFGAFQRAADLYAAKVPSMEQKDETPLIYQQWLNANLGASDLAMVTRQQEPNAKGLESIRKAILSLPGEAPGRHLDALAQAVAGSTDSLPAHLKPSYMRAALTIVQDRPDAEKIRDLVAYYDGLLREIELSLRVDGDAIVGHEQPFGMFLTVRHTAELERENAGGFGKYLRNQSQSPYYYNPYGTPPVDHRDELEKQMREKLSERFEIVSITFHDEKVQSRGYGREGWRETPLAYVLAKAKDAAVDRIPSMRLDVDFIDKHGPVVLPVESPAQLIDARGSELPARPATNLEVTHILDDRAVQEGMLTLEVKVTANGLVPTFEELFLFQTAGFTMDEITDSGPAVQRLSSEGEELTAVSERNWLLKLSADPAAKNLGSFQFPRPSAGELKVAYKRYEDADLVEVAPEIALAGVPLNASRLWPWMVLGTALLVAAVVVPMRRRRQTASHGASSTYHVPSTITPFTTLQLLRQIHDDGNLPLPPEHRGELSQSIIEIETYYFALPKDGASIPDLESIARTWVQRARTAGE